MTTGGRAAQQAVLLRDEPRRGASRTTDAHLIRLAEAHGARLATLDTGIPGAFLVPGAADAR